MANSRFQILITLLALCLLRLHFQPLIFVAAANGQVPGSTSSEGGGGGTGGGDAAASFAAAGSGGDQLSALCGIDLSSVLPPPYSNISNMVCVPVWNTFLLRYHMREKHITTIILSAIYTTGWVGMGFSEDGKMTGSSAMVGWFNKKGHARIIQYYLQGARPSQVIPNAGELPLTKVPPAVVLHGAMIYLAFQLQFDKPLHRQPIILAFSSRYPNHLRLSSHDDKRTLMFDFNAGSASALNVPFSQMKKNHGILGTIGWGLIMPVGAIFARYLKHKDPLWYYLHAITQFIGFIIGLSTIVLGQQLYDKMNARVPTHRGIGIFVLVLSILQILAFFLRPNKDAKIRKYWNWYHHWFGRMALFFGALNVVVGIEIGYAGNAWKIGYGFLMGIILVSVIVLEALLWMRGSEPEKTIPPQSFQMNSIQ